MEGRRQAPDRRSPVQPGKTGIAPFVVLAIVAAGAAWALRDSWVDWLKVPYSSSPNETSGPPGSGSTQAPGSQVAQGDLAGLFSADDYPADAQMRDEQGTVRVELEIDKRGRVSQCNVIDSSGSGSLDSATCRIVKSRARFTPAHDSSGRPVRDTYTQSITWRLEG